MALAPIVLFVYNRPEHTRTVLQALSQNELAADSVLYIFADGPKADATPESIDKINETRTLLGEKQWCGEVIIKTASQNQGLANSVIAGVTEVITKHGKAIALEDDLITSKYFLRFMNDALKMYESEKDVLSIGAFNFFATNEEVTETFFVPIPDCWGWATWKDRWALFESNPQKLIDQLRAKGIMDEFNLHGAYNFESLLRDQIQGNISSWAIRWQAVAYLTGKLSLYPKYSVTKNIGFDESGTHGGNDVYSKKIRFAEHPVVVEKIKVATDPAITAKMIDGYRQVTAPSGNGGRKVRSFIKGLLPPVLSSTLRKLKPHRVRAIQWLGDYPDLASAQAECTGYDDASILAKTKTAILKVISGEAAGERDSVLFDKVPYHWPVIASLLKIAVEGGNGMNVLDVGGALGSSYFQFKAFSPSSLNIKWLVLEQPSHVTAGNAEIANSELSFTDNLGTAFKNNQPDVLLLSSVLQYLPDPHQMISDLAQRNVKYILIDRTGFIDGKERLTVQTVPATIYDASYPCWFFNESEFLSAFRSRYNVLLDFDSNIDAPTRAEDGATLYWKGFLMKIKDA